VESFTDLDLLEELQAYHQPLAERREGGITAGEYAKAQGYTRKTARKKLNAMVEEGLLVKEHCKIASGREFVYYKA
jgi:Fic family protein